MAYIDDVMNKLLTKIVTPLLIIVFAAPVAADQVFTRSGELTLLYTNDIESVYEPVESTWRKDIRRMGGISHLATLIKLQRASAGPSLLLDAGDIFTGSLTKATSGRLAFDLYSEMGYDAVNLGNHEFEYGWQALREVMPRARFSVMNANIFFEGLSEDQADVSFGQPYAIFQKGSMRIGVIGSMGVDAFRNTIMKSHREGLTVRPPVEIVQPIVDRIRDEVDLLIVLTHQNRTAPMQTDKEADPEVQRGFEEDYELAGQLRGVDMIIGGHSDHGLLSPVRHPDTGTYIGMTFGQGMHLGYARFEVGEEVTLKEARLIPVDSDNYEPAGEVSQLISNARRAHPELGVVVAEVQERVARRYYRESPLGNLLADLLREQVGGDLVVFPAGAIRADLEKGPLRVEQVMNVFPFTDTIALVDMKGDALTALMEKVVSLDYGLAQISGAEMTFDRSRDKGSRVLSLAIAGEPFDENRVYRVVTLSFTATGGEGYDMFGDDVIVTEQRVSEVLLKGFRERELIAAPASGRLLDRDRVTD